MVHTWFNNLTYLFLAGPYFRKLKSWAHFIAIHSFIEPQQGWTISQGFKWNYFNPRWNHKKRSESVVIDWKLFKSLIFSPFQYCLSISVFRTELLVPVKNFHKALLNSPSTSFIQKQNCWFRLGTAINREDTSTGSHCHRLSDLWWTYY